MRLLHLKSKLSQHRFEINHILVFFAIVISFQVLLVFFQSSLVSNFLNDAQRWFQKYHAERLAIVTSASLENLFENQQRLQSEGTPDEAQTVYSVNVFFKQLVLQRSIEEIALILLKDDRIYLVSNGQQMNAYFKRTLLPYEMSPSRAPNVGVAYFTSVRDEMLRDRNADGNRRSASGYVAIRGGGCSPDDAAGRPAGPDTHHAHRCLRCRHSV